MGERERGGSALDGAMRERYEARLGVDLGGVRVHTNDPRAASLGARAFTSGRDIHLGPGEGDASLAHQLVHVAQAANGDLGDEGQTRQRRLQPTPALYYSRGLVGPTWMFSTSLSADWGDCPAEFTRWGKRVMQWVRKTVPNWYRYKHHRITAKAEAARVAGMEMAF